MIKKYEKYKDSGVEWLGEVPSHWAIVRIKYMCSVSGGGTPTTTVKTFWNGGIPWFTPKDMKTDYLLKSEDTLSLEGVAASPAKIVQPGCVFMVVRSGILKHSLPVGINCIPATVNQDIRVLKFKMICSPYFFVWWVKGNEHSLLDVWRKQGTTVESIEQSYVSDTGIPLPPTSEQTAIAAYLDTRTAAIDQKISFLEKKAESYRQLKQSLINETVTRGLNKNVKLKDSGMEWIGMVPEHWEVKPISSVTTPVSIKNNPNEELLSVYRDYGVIVKSSRDDNNNKPGQDLTSYKLVEEGYLVINKMKAWQGSLGISPTRGIVSPAYITCRTNKKIVRRRYLHNLLRCKTYIHEYNRISYGVRIDQWDMRYDDFKYVPVLLPPVSEQEDIANYIDNSNEKIDAINISIGLQVEKLKELRKTLINDVVTGKVKVTT